MTVPFTRLLPADLLISLLCRPNCSAAHAALLTPSPPLSADPQARKAILDIHTSKWQAPPSDALKMELAHMAVGYGGADIKALCAEAALCALRRRYVLCVVLSGSTCTVYRICMCVCVFVEGLEAAGWSDIRAW